MKLQTGYTRRSLAVRGGIVGWGTALQAKRPRIRFNSIGSFHWHNPSGCTIALVSTQTVREMSTTSISWGKSGRCIVLTTLPPSYSDCLKIWEPQFPGNLWVCNRPVQGLLAFRSANNLNKQSGKVKGDVNLLFGPFLSFLWNLIFAGIMSVT
jgi:hypothetical protein